MTRFRDMTDDQLRHEKATIDQALLARAELRRRERGEPMGSAVADESGNGGNGGTLRLPGGLSATWRGWGGILGLVVLAFMGSLGGLLYINHRGFQALEEREVERVKAIRETGAARAEQTAQMSAEHRAINDNLESVVYVLTLPDAERKTLRLKMPRRLQEMERR